MADKPKMRKGSYDLTEKQLNKQGVGQKARRLVQGGISNTEFVKGKGVINKSTGKPLTGTVIVDGKTLRYKDGKRVTTSGIGMAKQDAKPAAGANQRKKADNTLAAKPEAKKKAAPAQSGYQAGSGMTSSKRRTPAGGTPVSGYERSRGGSESRLSIPARASIIDQRRREQRRIAKRAKGK